MRNTEAKFYLTDLSEHNIKTGKEMVTKDVLFFSLSKPTITGDAHIAGTSFDNKASRDHVAQYRPAYEAFKKLNPSYKCKWPELVIEVAPVVEVKVSAVQVEPEPVVIEEKPSEVEVSSD